MSQIEHVKLIMINRSILGDMFNLRHLVDFLKYEPMFSFVYQHKYPSQHGNHLLCNKLPVLDHIQ